MHKVFSDVGTDIVQPKPGGVPTFKPLPGTKTKHEYPVLGSKLISQNYSSIAVIGPVGSGKTTTVFNLLDQCCGPETHLIIFSTTVDQDIGWIGITKWLDDNNLSYTAYTSIFRTDDEGHKVNLVDLFIETVKEQSKVDKAKRKEEKEGSTSTSGPIGGAWQDPCEKKEREHLPTIDPFLVKEDGVTFQYPPYILIFDDIADELKNAAITKLIKTYRHYKTKIIISSQHFVDAPSAVRQNIRDWFLYRGLDSHKLKTIFGATGSAISFDRFINRYNDATTGHAHGFLHIDVAKGEMINSRGLMYTVAKRSS